MIVTQHSWELLSKCKHDGSKNIPTKYWCWALAIDKYNDWVSVNTFSNSTLNNVLQWWNMHWPIAGMCNLLQRLAWLSKRRNYCPAVCGYCHTQCCSKTLRTHYEHLCICPGVVIGVAAAGTAGAGDFALGSILTRLLSLLALNCWKYFKICLDNLYLMSWCLIKTYLLIFTEAS